MASDRPITVFDLDGTLIRRDTFLPFLFHYALRRRRLRPLATAGWWLAGYAGRLLSDTAAKERLLTSFLAGEAAASIEEHRRWFCERWVSRRLHRLAIARLNEHRAEGHRLILLSASPSVYVEAIARFLDIDEVLCTQVGFRDGCCLGTLEGGNCKGPAKLRRLQEHLGTEVAPAESYAYGDSVHDRPVLEWVRYGFLVGRRAIAPLVPSGGSHDSGRRELSR